MKIYEYLILCFIIYEFRVYEFFVEEHLFADILIIFQDSMNLFIISFCFSMVLLSGYSPIIMFIRIILLHAYTKHCYLDYL